MKVLSDLDVSGKKVFLRADLDVLLGKAQVSSIKYQVSSEGSTRLTNLASTVEYLLGHGARQIIIAGHIDRPKGPDPALSIKNLLPVLEKILRKAIVFRSDPFSHHGVVTTTIGSQRDSIGPSVLQNGKKEGRIWLLENLRFWPGEEKNDVEFAKQLARLADIYVNDAFATCHRIHASIVALPQLFSDVEDPEGHRPRRAAGLHLDREVKVLEGLLTAPKRPFAVIIGGAKIETKVPVVENLAKIADYVLVGGEIAKELTVNGSQFTDSDKVIIARLTADTKDIDQASTDKFKSVIKTAKTIVWNGPMGVFEEGFDKGTMAIAQALVDSGAYSVVGGGETTQFLEKAGLLGKFGFVSSGGGAMLEFLAGKELPGIKALE